MAAPEGLSPEPEKGFPQLARVEVGQQKSMMERVWLLSGPLRVSFPLPFQPEKLDFNL